MVEGHGEEQAVPELVRRIGLSLEPPVFPDVPRPIRTPKDRLKRPGELERAVRLAAEKAGPVGAVLVLVDADEDCPAQLGPELLGRAMQQLSERPVGVVVARCEYENWFLAAARSLAGRRDLADGLAPPGDPEGIRGAKEWLGDHMKASRRYSEVLDQPALTAMFSLDEARSSDSFDKCFREVARLLRAASSEE